jgi:MerR family copper efflux transcriptional regulator
MAMKIGELAELAGTSVKTIRYYDRVGVLRPKQRSGSGYRLYDEDALDRYRFVRAAQAVGLRLGEIREIVALRDRGVTPCAFVAELIGRRADELDARIVELIALRDELRSLGRRARNLDPRQCDPRLICHVIEPGPEHSRPGGG